MNIQVEKIELIKRLAEVNNEKIIKQVKAILMPEKKIDETERLMSKPGMVKKLKEARREIKDGKGVKMDVKGLWEIIFAPKALEDIKYWKLSGNSKIRKKITDLIISISKEPFTGIGKPEPLKYDFAGCWSRRINQEHRIIYEVDGNSVHILSLKDHY